MNPPIDPIPALNTDGHADEPALIRSARAGDVESFNVLVLRHQSRIYNLCYRIVGDPDSAADAAQDTFIAAFQKLAQFTDQSDDRLTEPGSRFRAWLSRIATNRCYDELRRRQRHPHRSLDDPNAGMHLISPIESPEAAVQRADLSRAIQGCLDALPVDQRTVIVLCDIQDFDYQAIAVITGQALGTVKSRIARARNRLRDCLSGATELFSDLVRRSDRQP